MNTAAARYNALSSARSTALEAAREASRLTIPGLIPHDGQNEHYVPSQPYQSVGADGVRSLSSRLLLALFSPNVPFFRLELDAQVAAALGEEKNAADATLAQFSQSASALMEDKRVRPVMAEALRHLIIAGNSLLWLPPKTPPRLFRLDQYVVKRNASGEFLTIIVREQVYPSSLSDEVRAAVALPAPSHDNEQRIDVFTVVERVGDNVEHYQEINGKRVPGSEGKAPADKSGWVPLRWLAVPGSDYGRSHVTEYIGDLLSLEDLSQAIVQFSAAASRIVNLVSPNSTLDVNKLAAARSGDYLYGNADEISSVQLQKSQDFAVVASTAERIEQRVAKAFMTQNFRHAERVTAEEIRSQSEELETTLGGTYSLLSAELQLPIANRYLYLAAEQNLIPDLPSDITPKVVTGMAALGRAAEVNRLRTFASDGVQILGPQVFAAHVNATAFLTRLGVEHGVTALNSLLKSEEQLAEEQQQAMMAQASQQMVGAAAGPVAEAAVNAAME
jgi:hypothetical protein